MRKPNQNKDCALTHAFFQGPQAYADHSGSLSQKMCEIANRSHTSIHRIKKISKLSLVLLETYLQSIGSPRLPFFCVFLAHDSHWLCFHQTINSSIAAWVLCFG